MNKVILMGRLTRDAEIRHSTQGETNSMVARFTVAVDRRVRRDSDEQQTADFIGCVAFGRTAEFMDRFGRKGTKFLMEGRIQTGSYTNRDGQKVYTTDIVIDNVEFAESKNAAGGSGNGGSGSFGGDRPEPSGAAGDGFMNLPDDGFDELPFK